MLLTDMESSCSTLLCWLISMVHVMFREKDLTQLLSLETSIFVMRPLHDLSDLILRLSLLLGQLFALLCIESCSAFVHSHVAEDLVAFKFN